MLLADDTMTTTLERPKSPEILDASFPDVQVLREDELGEVLASRNNVESNPVAHETYGRSLTTMRSVGECRARRRFAGLGRRMFGWKMRHHDTLTPAEQQGYVEFLTSVAEGYGTDRALGNSLEVRDFDELSVVNGLVMARDLSRAVSEMTGNGLICGYEEMLKNPWFAPQYVRSQWDHKNALSVDSMARRETWYNTRIIVSPYVEEAAEESGEDKWGHVGYVPHLRRGFVQLYHMLGNGKVLTGSLSFDGSDKIRLLEIFNKHLGADIPEDTRTDDWLRYALTGVFTDRQAKEFAVALADLLTDEQYEKSSNTVDVTEQYGDLIQSAYSESYVFACESLVLGRQSRRMRKVIKKLHEHSQSFNSHYQEALKKLRRHPGVFNDADAAVIHELLVYSTIEMIRSLHQNNVSYDDAVRSMNGAEGFIGALSAYGATGAEEGRDYFACGLSISPGDQLTTEFALDDALSQAADGSLSAVSFVYNHDHVKKRQSIAETLTNARRKGDCLACPEKRTTVHGCGLCTDCNQVWCTEFVDNGIGLTIEQVASRAKTKSKPNQRRPKEQRGETKPTVLIKSQKQKRKKLKSKA